MQLADDREEVHAALTELYGESGGLRNAPPELGIYFDDAAIARVAKKYMSQSTDIVAGGQGVVVSAGPPGAGKSEALHSLSLSGYRIIDPDVAKDLLLDEARRHGLLNYRNGVVLPDGKPVGLRELASHVHVFSSKVTDVVRKLSLAAGENVVVDGTLSWSPLADLYVDEFYRAGYEGLEVVAVEIPLAMALERARQRWWSGRKQDEYYGGRFVPEFAIRGCYDVNSPYASICSVNALDLAEKAAEGLGRGKLRRFDVDARTGQPHQTSVTDFG